MKTKKYINNFDPKTKLFHYTEYTDEHYLKIKKNNGLVFDENYPYFDNSKSFLFKQKLIRILLILIVFPITRIRLGLRIKGRKNIKNNKELFKKGVITISNNVHLWDYICINRALMPHKMHTIVWPYNVRSENSFLVRMVGGVPIPDNNINGSIKFNNEVNKYLQNGGLLHIYPEGSMWEYYKPIRPFKRGVAHYAINNNVPIIPLAFSYRKPGFIRRKIFHQIALFTLNIGDAIIPDYQELNKDNEIDLINKCHKEVCILSGVDPIDNIYEANYNKTKRIDYY